MVRLVPLRCLLLEFSRVANFLPPFSVSLFIFSLIPYSNRILLLLCLKSHHSFIHSVSSFHQHSSKCTETSRILPNFLHTLAISRHKIALFLCVVVAVSPVCFASVSATSYFPLSYSHCFRLVIVHFQTCYTLILV